MTGFIDGIFLCDDTPKPQAKGKVVYMELPRRSGKRLQGEALVDAVLRRAHFFALNSSRQPNPHNPKGAKTAVVIDIGTFRVLRGVAAAPSLTGPMTAAETFSNDGGDDA